MRILITGASGQLGAYLLSALHGTAHDVVAWSHTRSEALFGLPLDPIDLASLEQASVQLREARPHAVIHTAAMASIAACHNDPERARRVNCDATAALAAAAADIGARFIL